jgi:hypothetical protein
MVILNSEQCWQFPNIYILLLQPQVFLDRGNGILQKLGGGCLCECGWGGHHITRAQNGGDF